MIWLIVFSCALMVVQDFFGVFLVVAEACGRSLLAGMMDGLGDFPARLGAGIAGATLAQHGFGSEFLLVSFIALTSVFSTSTATRLARRVKSAPEIVIAIATDQAPGPSASTSS